LPLFGQILAALYQEDIVEEDDIRAWHAKPESQGQSVKSTSLQENYKRCWIIGAHMIRQFDASDDETEDDADDESESGAEKPVAGPADPSPAGASSSEEGSSEGDEESDGEDDSEQDDLS